jgi:hypothetical protein
MATDNIRVRIKQHISRFPYWYKDRINDEFDVKDYTPEYYIVEDAKLCILKSDCEVIGSLSTTVNSETKETAEQKANSIDMNTYVNHLSEIVGIDKQPETQETMKEKNKVTNLPEVIYLQLHDGLLEETVDFKQLYGVTWCEDRINDSDVPYVLSTASASLKQPEAQPQQEGEEVEQVEKKDFLLVLTENWQAQIAGYYNLDKTDEERKIRNAVIQEYQDLIAIYKSKYKTQ